MQPTFSILGLALPKFMKRQEKQLLAEPSSQGQIKPHEETLHRRKGVQISKQMLSPFHYNFLHHFKFGVHLQIISP